MEHAVQSFITLAAAHPHLALAIVAFVAFAESLAIVGTLVPAAVVMFAAGALVGHGVIGMPATLAVAVAGAVAGDALSYELGRRYEDRVRPWAVFRRHAAAVDRTEAFIRRRGAMSILLARFLAPVRAFVPLLAGFSHMPRLSFYVVNVLSALLWAPAHVLPGVLFGASLHMAEAVSGRLALLAVLLLAFLWGTVRLVTGAIRWLAPVAARLRHGLLELAQSRRSRLARATQALLDPARPDSYALLFGLVVLIGAGWTFFALLEDVISKDPLVQADLAVFGFLQQLRTDAADGVMIAITGMGSVGVMLPLIVAVLAWLLWRRCWRTAAYWVANSAFAELLVQVLKRTIARQRPLAMYQGGEQFSFPSGHATVSMVVLGFLAFLLARRQGLHWRLGVAAVIAVYVALVAFSRLYLGAHWFSDVLGGMSFGLAWVAFVALVYTQRQVQEDIEPGRMGAVAVAAIVLSTMAWSQWHGGSDAQRYVQRPQTVAMPEAAWAAGGWRELPRRRQELAGRAEEAFSLQWACSADGIAQRLARAGWRRPPPWSLKTALLALAPATAQEDLPPLPRFDRGRRALLTFERPRAGVAGTNEVLRLWRSDLELTVAGQVRVPLWYGAIYLERRKGLGNAWRQESTEDPGPLASELIPYGVSRVPEGAGVQGAGRAPLLLRCPA